MSIFTPIAFLAVAAAIRPAHAFFNNNNNTNHNTTSRVIGIVIAVAVVLLIFCLCFARNRRNRTARTGILAGPGAMGGKPSRFGGAFGAGGGFSRPWGAQNQTTGYPNQYQGQGYGPQPAPGTEYPPAGEPVPPPYTAAQQPGSYNSQSAGPSQGYAPPPGPPPQAHVNNKQNDFVGGFRS
ncbi:hypothetical protein B0H11DRAFT_2021620 [Mycena galericulata]|nr:hypothetical protein B0H11DRAFT_2021620 [Mycena galericulata]